MTLLKITKWLFLTALILAAGCQPPAQLEQAEIEQVEVEEVVQPEVDVQVQAHAQPEVAEIGTQLKINKETLLGGATQRIRTDAAGVMLLSNELLARQILIETLLQSENTQARAAVCKALSAAKDLQEPIKSKEDFINPLIEMLKTSDSVHGKLAAEAILLFDFEQTYGLLEQTALASSLPVQARVNAMYALKLQPDVKAILTLMKLLDDSEGSVRLASESILLALGMPVGKDAETRLQMIDELRRKGRYQFLRDWLIRQQAQIRKMGTELGYWQKKYLSALDKIYDELSDDAAKGKFLVEHLQVDKASVRLLALEKVSQWRVGTKSNLPAAIGPILIELVSDTDRQVRLKTASLLSLMVELDSSQKLLQQIAVEPDDEVKTEMFVALGGACHYAFSANSGVKLGIKIRKQTLELAAKYVTDKDPVKSYKGAKVIRRLLGQDGLSSKETARYINLLAGRYDVARSKGDVVLQGELLNAMAGLCAQNSYKAESSELFGPIFEAALSDESNLIRETAVEGLIYIDKAMAIRLLRKGFAEDSSEIIRARVIGLAGEVGGGEDLVWLAERMQVASDSEAVWQSMVKIFARSGAVVLEEWMGKFGAENSVIKLSDTQMTAFLEIAERKAVAEGKSLLAAKIRESLARVYKRNRAYERAAEYFGTLRKGAEKDEDKSRFLGELLEVYLVWGNVEAASQLVNNSLLERDLGPDDVIIRLIDRYLAKPFEGTDPKAVLAAFGQLKPEGRPQWDRHYRRWTGQSESEKAKPETPAKQAETPKAEPAAPVEPAPKVEPEKPKAVPPAKAEEAPKAEAETGDPNAAK